MVKHSSVAIIDIGSNSIKLLVATRSVDGHVTALAHRTIDARISAGISRAAPRLSEDGMSRGAEAIHALLADAGAVHGLCAHPRMPSVDAQGVDPEHDPIGAGPLVIRWLLRRDRAYAEVRATYAPFDRLVEPDSDARVRIAALLRAAASRGRGSLVIVNNKAEGSAPLSIEALARQSAG